MATEVRHLRDIALRLEHELRTMEIDVGTAFWIMQAIVRLHVAAMRAARALDPDPPEAAPLMTMRDTRGLLGWLDPDDARRLREDIDQLYHEHAITCMGECLLQEILGEE